MYQPIDLHCLFSYSADRDTILETKDQSKEEIIGNLADIFISLCVDSSFNKYNIVLLFYFVLIISEDKINCFNLYRHSWV